MLFNLAVAAVAATLAGVSAQTPNGTSICDYYTTALLKNNTADNQLTLLTLVVNTAVIGNYTKPNVGIAVPGILAPGTVNGTKVNLLGYFNGTLVSSNRGGVATAINFLDDGGAAPLLLNKPANGTSSNQYKLLTHLYEYFGTALGCSLQSSNSSFGPYSGQASQYTVHKYMDLSLAEVTYFITQVGLSAASFGVGQADATAVGGLLGKLFNVKCAPATTVIPAQGPQLQSICTDSSCPNAPSFNCSAYDATVTEPSTTSGPASTSAGSGSGSGSATTTSGSSGSSASPSSGATALSVSGFLAGVAALFAMIV